MQPPAADNPSAASASPTEASCYFGVNVARLSFGELRNCAPNFLAFIALAAIKILRLKLRAEFGQAPERSRIGELDEVPTALRHHLIDTSAALQAAGFSPRFSFFVPYVGDREGVDIVHVNRERTVLAAALFVRVGEATDTSVALMSLLSDGRVICTTNARPRLLQPPGFETVHRVGATVAELAGWHQEFLAKTTPARPMVLDDVAQRQLLLDNQQQIFEFHRQRGVWWPLSWAEVARLTAKSPQHDTPAQQNNWR